LRGRNALVGFGKIGGVSLLSLLPILCSMGSGQSDVFAGTMTNFQAFCEGFWSAWDFTRPFSEKPKLRSRKEVELIDYEEFREELDLNKNVWESVGDHFGAVGGYLNKAMGTLDEEVKQNGRN
jgi:hypothetical protein